MTAPLEAVTAARVADAFRDACLAELRALKPGNVHDYAEGHGMTLAQFETSATMARLIFSGVTTRLPDLKIVIHHLGAMIPFFDARLETGWATLGSRTSDEDYSGVLKMLGKPLLQCFKDFYADTALCGGYIGTVCGLEFYGPDHVLFASDAPFGAEGGASYIRETVKVIASLDIPAADKEKICYRNAQSLFKL